MLAKGMARGIFAGAKVLELGAGTGTLTDYIRSAGVCDKDLYLVEQNARLAAILRERFPKAGVQDIDAETVAELNPELRGRLDFVISGLPILWFNRDKKAAVLKAAFSLLRSGGVFQQFTYLGKPPISEGLLSELGLRARLISFAPVNLPPAFVYRITPGRRSGFNDHVFRLGGLQRRLQRSVAA